MATVTLASKLDVSRVVTKSTQQLKAYEYGTMRKE